MNLITKILIHYINLGAVSLIAISKFIYLYTGEQYQIMRVLNPKNIIFRISVPSYYILFPLKLYSFDIYNI